MEKAGGDWEAWKSAQAEVTGEAAELWFMGWAAENCPAFLDRSADRKDESDDEDWKKDAQFDADGNWMGEEWDKSADH